MPLSSFWIPRQTFCMMIMPCISFLSCTLFPVSCYLYWDLNSSCWTPFSFKLVILSMQFRELFILLVIHQETELSNAISSVHMAWFVLSYNLHSLIQQNFLNNYYMPGVLDTGAAAVNHWVKALFSWCYVLLKEIDNQFLMVTEATKQTESNSGWEQKPGKGSGKRWHWAETRIRRRGQPSRKRQYQGQRSERKWAF